MSLIDNQAQHSINPEGNGFSAEAVQPKKSKRTALMVGGSALTALVVAFGAGKAMGGGAEATPNSITPVAEAPEQVTPVDPDETVNDPVLENEEVTMTDLGPDETKLGIENLTREEIDALGDPLDLLESRPGETANEVVERVFKAQMVILNQENQAEQLRNFSLFYTNPELNSGAKSYMDMLRQKREFINLNYGQERADMFTFEQKSELIKVNQDDESPNGLGKDTLRLLDVNVQVAAGIQSEREYMNPDGMELTYGLFQYHTVLHLNVVQTGDGERLIWQTASNEDIT